MLSKEEISRQDAKAQRKLKIGLDEYLAAIYFCVRSFHAVGGEVK